MNSVLPMTSITSYARVFATFAVCISLISACAPREPDPIVVDDTSTGDEANGTAEQASPEQDTAGELQMVMSDDACASDADCVPAGCCHAAACVGRDSAPQCADALCTTDCRFGTLDCGGGCLCFEGRCAARLSRAPQFATPER